MKPRHATALGLFVIAACSMAQNTGSSAGWLLIVPPLTTAGDADIAAPLSQWQILGEFARQIDCSTSMAEQQFGAHRRFGPIGNAQTYYETLAVRILNGQCVSSAATRLN
jgi:hypothetical protein